MQRGCKMDDLKCAPFSLQTSSKSNSAEVEIIRYQVLIPVTEVQVRIYDSCDVLLKSQTKPKPAGSRLEREGRGLALRVGADPPQEPDAAQGREALPPLQQVLN